MLSSPPKPTMPRNSPSLRRSIANTWPPGPMRASIHSRAAASVHGSGICAICCSASGSLPSSRSKCSASDVTSRRSRSRRVRNGSRIGVSTSIAGQHSLHLLHIAAAEQADMDQQRIEIIQIAALFEEARTQRAALGVAGKERITDAAEQGHKRELDLGIG